MKRRTPTRSTRKTTSTARTAARAGTRRTAAARDPQAAGLGPRIGVSAAGDPVPLDAPLPAQTTRDTGEVIDEILQMYKEGVLSGDDDGVLTALSRIDGLTHVYFGLDRSQPLLSRPQNARQVPDAGRAIVSTARAFELEGRLMRIDADALEEDLHQHGRVARLHGRYQLAIAPVEAGLASLEVRIDDDVRGAFGRIASAVDSDAALQVSLDGALQLIKGPAKLAARTRGRNERMVGRATAEVLKEGTPKDAAPATPAAASVTIPVQPQIGAAASPTAAPPPAPRARTRRR